MSFAIWVLSGIVEILSILGVGLGLSGIANFGPLHRPGMLCLFIAQTIFCAVLNLWIRERR